MIRTVLAPAVNIAVLLVIWDRAVAWSGTQIFPSPWSVVLGIVELAREGLLLKYTVSSLYRVTWSFLLAVLVGVPFGLVLGWFARAYEVFNPLVQLMRPISPIAWIPLSILWVGVSETAPMFLIFLGFSFKTDGGEPNWPGTAYLSGLVLAASWLAEQLASPHRWYRRVTATGYGAE